MDNIGSVRRNLKSSIKKIQEKKTLVLISCIFIIVLTLLFFKLTYEETNTNVVEKYKDTLKNNPFIQRDLQPLLTCREINNEAYNYKLTDFYISSSFNSPLIGNQKRDYLSLEFFKEIIDSGARYLEFQINASSMNDLPEPVVGTGEHNNNWGDSLNFLKLDDILKTIKKSAFNNKMNYPLIVYLDFNSRNNHLIKRVGELINAYLGEYVVKNYQYTTLPFVFEKMCVFNKKVIFLSSINESNYMNTPLQTIIMPEKGLVRRVYFDDITRETTIENTLSQKNQRLDKEKFNKQYYSYKEVLKKVNKLGNQGKTFYDILKDEKYTNPLLHFNKVGLTIVIPHKKEDHFTVNYEPQSYWNNGCQIVSMNFQESLEKDFLDKINKKNYKLTSNDPIIIRYLSKFNKNSFILKSDDERFFETRIDEEKPMELFNIEENKKTVHKIKTDFSNKITDNNNINVFMINSYAYPDYYLDSNSGIIRFINKDEKNNKKSNNDYLFIFVPSKNKILNDKSAFSIIPINNIIDLDFSKEKVLTKNTKNFIYRTVSNNSHTLIEKSSFYPVKSSCNEESDNILSFRTVDEYDSPFLGYDNKILKTYIENDTNKMKESCCFNIINIPKKNYKLFLYIKHQYSSRYLQVLYNNLCVFNNIKLNDKNDKNKFEVIMEKNLYDNFSLKINNKFLTYNKELKKIIANEDNEENSATFKITNMNDSFKLSLLDKESGNYDTYLNNKDNLAIFNKNNINKNISLSCYLKFELS